MNEKTLPFTSFPGKNNLCLTDRFRGLSAGTLRMLAMVTMLLDHVGAVIIGKSFPGTLLISGASGYQALRAIGRMSCPIYAFLLTEGFLHTKDLKRYLARMACLALVSEIPFDLAFFGVPLEFSCQNNVFTLFFSLLMLAVLRKSEKRRFLYLPILCLGCAATYLLRTDYAVALPLLVGSFYLLRKDRLAGFLSGTAIVTLVNVSFGSLSGLVSGVISLFLVWFLYNGRKGRNPRAFSYTFYPLHLFILWLVAAMLLPSA